MADNDKRSVLNELERLYTDSSYSAQAYFEAAKSAEIWGRGIVFAPAVLAAVASFLVALGGPREWGAVGSLSAVVAATASFLGADRKANSLRETARKYTVLRHSARLERSLAAQQTLQELTDRVRALREQYASIVSSNEIASNRHFEKARQRITSGVLDNL